jgi:hypothetical protein
MTDPTFDAGLAERLRGYGEAGVRPINAIDVAKIAIARRTKRRRTWPRLLAFGLAAATLAGLGYAAGVANQPVPKRTAKQLAVISQESPLPTVGVDTAEPAMPTLPPNAPFSYGGDIVAGPDGANRSVWATDLGNGQTTKVVDQKPMATLSPDGRHVAYWSPEGIHLVQVVTGVDTLLPDSRAGDFWTDVLYPTLPSCLIDNPNCGTRPAFLWSPNSVWVTWGNCPVNQPCEVFASNALGGSVRVIEANGRNTDADRIQWRWSGRNIVFDDRSGTRILDIDQEQPLAAEGLVSLSNAGDAMANGASGHLTITDRSGRQLGDVQFPSNLNVGPVVWSPDGQRLAVMLDPPPHRGLPVVDKLAVIDRSGAGGQVDLGADGILLDTTPIWEGAGWPGLPGRFFATATPFTSVGTERYPSDGIVVGDNGAIISRIPNVAYAYWLGYDELLVVGKPSGQLEDVMADGSNRHSVGPDLPTTIDQLAMLW